MFHLCLHLVAWTTACLFRYYLILCIDVKFTYPYHQSIITLYCTITEKLDKYLILTLIAFSSVSSAQKCSPDIQSPFMAELDTAPHSSTQPPWTRPKPALRMKATEFSFRGLRVTSRLWDAGMQLLWLKSDGCWDREDSLLNLRWWISSFNDKKMANPQEFLRPRSLSEVLVYLLLSVWVLMECLLTANHNGLVCQITQGLWVWFPFRTGNWT